MSTTGADLRELWHWPNEDDDSAKFLGIFSTKDRVDAAIALLKTRPGFAQSDSTAFFSAGLELNKPEERYGFFRTGPAQRSLTRRVIPLKPATELLGRGGSWIYVLWHGLGVAAGTVKLCGYFSELESAYASRSRLAMLDGYRDYPRDFAVLRVTLDEVRWAGGFRTIPVTHPKSANHPNLELLSQTFGGNTVVVVNGRIRMIRRVHRGRLATVESFGNAD